MWSDIPNLRHLKAFQRVVETRSVSEAAREVHLSQPAVTQAIAALEARLGARLVEHGADGMWPTPAGRLLHARAGRALDLIRQGAREFQQIEARRDNRGFGNFDELVTVAQLRALSAMSRTSSFSLAGRLIGISQPSIHRAARDLERLIGVPLFARTHRGIELTRAAEALALAAKLAFAEIRQGLAEVSESVGVEAGQIVVGSMPLARSFIVPEALNRLSHERPTIKVRVVDGPYDDLLHGLRHGDLDLLIGALRDPAPAPDVVQHALLRDPLAIVARAGHPLVGRRRIAKADLLAYPWIVPPDGTPTRSYFNGMFTPRELAALPGMIETSSLILVRGVLSRSDRLTIISAHQVMHEQAEGLLAALPLDLEGSHRLIGLTTRRGWRPTPAQETLLGHLRALSGEVENGAAVRQAYSEIE